MAQLKAVLKRENDPGRIRINISKGRGCLIPTKGTVSDVVRYVTCSFNPSSMQLAATTNKGAAAIAYISEVQAALDTQMYNLSPQTQWMP